MKKIYAFLAVCLFTFIQAHATTYYWVGPSNGKWSDPANWSLGGGSYPYPGGAGVPGPADNAAMPFVGGPPYLVNMDVSPTISAFLVGLVDVKLVASVNTTLTVTRNWQIRGTVTDSTTEDVKFNVVLDGAFADITPTIPLPLAWIFSGRVPVSSGNGATVSLVGNARMTVAYGASLVYRRNSGDIASEPTSSINFLVGSTYLLENKQDVVIPAANWAPASVATSSSARDTTASLIQLTGVIGNVRHSSKPTYGSLRIDLTGIVADLNLNLPNKTFIQQDLSISGTTTHTLTLLNATGPSDSVVVIVGDDRNLYQPLGSIGTFAITGNSRVSLARAPETAPGTFYRLIAKDFSQSGGTFSLQDADNASGSSVLSVGSSFRVPAGTFTANSTATGPGARFVVEMQGPSFVNRAGGTSIAAPVSFIVNNGILDNATHMVTLRMAYVPFIYPTNIGYIVWSPTGITLPQPLQVGKLELNGGPVITSAANPLTVANPSPSAIQVINKNSYVEGPLVRATNSTSPYVFPTGKTIYIPAIGRTPPIPFNPDSCAVIPASAAPSTYQVEYVRSRYADTTVSSPFRGVDTSRYWNISKLSGADAQVQLFLSSAVPQARATDNLVVAHYVGGKWVSEQGTVFSPGNAATGSVTSKVLSSFSPFTFGYGAFINAPLPIHLISFDGHAENGAARLNWKVAEPAARFEVLRSGDGINFSQIGTVQAVSLQQQYSYLDSRLPAGNNFYRLRSVEKDGSVSLSDVIMVSSTGQLTELMTLAPTVVRSTASLRINAVKEGQLQLVVTDMSGRSWKRLVLAVRAGSSANLVNFSDLPAGTYQISGYLDGKQTAAIRFIKQ